MIALICGDMFSGKTTELFRRIRRAKRANKIVQLFKYARDDRYGRQMMASSHDGVHMEAIPVTRLEVDQIIPGSVIGIDEGQFIDNLVKFCITAADLGCQVHVSALHSDFRQQAFKNIAELFPQCEEILRLRAICFKCKEEAGFTMRTVQGEELELIGGEEMYQAVCRKCFA